MILCLCMDAGEWERGVLLAPDDESLFTDIEAVVERKLLCGSLDLEGHVDGPPDEARLLEPRGIAVDVRRQRVYITELNSVRVVDLRDGCVTTLAGGEEEGDATDAPAATAVFNNLRGAALSPDGARLAVCDFWNHCVREVDLGDTDPQTQVLVRRRVGGGVAFSRPGGLSTPNDVAFDLNGRLYIACGSGFDDDTIRSMSPDGTMALEAGVLGSAGDADGPCSRATFDSPQGIAVDDSSACVGGGAGLDAWRPDLYVADYCNHIIRKVTRGRVITIGGKAGVPGDADGDGSESRFTEPTAICVSSAPLAGSGERTIYVAEGCGRLRWLRRVWCCAAENESASHYLVGTIIDTPELWAPRGLTVTGASGDLLVADTGKSVVWQLCLRSSEQHRKTLARKRLAMSLALHLRAGVCSPSHILSADLVESVCKLGSLTPPLAAALHSMPRPQVQYRKEAPPIVAAAQPCVVGATVPVAGLNSDPEHSEVDISQQSVRNDGGMRGGAQVAEQGDDALRLAEEVSVAEAARRALLARIATAEELLAISDHDIQHQQRWQQQQ